jgi:hypothetical protein
MLSAARTRQGLQVSDTSTALVADVGLSATVSIWFLRDQRLFGFSQVRRGWVALTSRICG